MHDDTDTYNGGNANHGLVRCAFVVAGIAIAIAWWKATH